MDGRILEAARTVYAQHGWAGFTVKAVALAGGVSRDAVNRRFASREELLIEALAASGDPVIYRPTGDSLHPWLLDLATGVFRIFTTANGRAHLRILLDVQSVPDLFRSYRKRVLEPAQAMLREQLLAIAEAEQRRDSDAAAILEDVIGATLLLALMNQDIDPGDDERFSGVDSHLAAIVSRALSVHASG